MSSNLGTEFGTSRTEGCVLIISVCLSFFLLLIWILHTTKGRKSVKIGLAGVFMRLNLQLASMRRLIFFELMAK